MGGKNNNFRNFIFIYLFIIYDIYRQEHTHDQETFR